MKKLVLVVFVCFLLGSVAHGANDVTKVPMRIDTFGADVTIKARNFHLKRMVITAYTSAKTVTFLNGRGDVCLVLEVPTGSTINWPNTDDPVSFPEGFIFDDSASDLAANDFIFIWEE